MALSKEQADAYEGLEEAIARMVKAFECDDEGELIQGWTVLIAAVGQSTCECEAHVDELDTISPVLKFSRRGQPPILTRGLIEEALDYLRT